MKGKLQYVVNSTTEFSFMQIRNFDRTTTVRTYEGKPQFVYNRSSSILQSFSRFRCIVLPNLSYSVRIFRLLYRN